MSIGTMLFNPFTGKPRDPRDIASDPRGVLVWDGEKPLRASPPAEQAKPSAGAYTFPSDKLVWRLIEARQSAHDLKETVELNAAMFGLAEDIMSATLPAERLASVPEGDEAK